MILINLQTYVGGGGTHPNPNPVDFPQPPCAPKLSSPPSPSEPYAHTFGTSPTPLRRRSHSNLQLRLRAVLLRRLLPLLPHSGTAAGLHQYNNQLEDYSAAGVQKEIAALHLYEKKLTAIDPAALDANVAADYQILLNNIRSQLLSLEVIRNWEKNPDNYSSGVTNSIFVLMERPFAPVDVRLRSAIEREKLIPQVFVEARKNLKNPPRIFTEIALEQIDGIISFFQNDVPLAFKDATDPAAKAEFAKTNAAVIEALKILRRMDEVRSSRPLQRRLPPRRRNLQQEARYDEMVDIPLDHLLQIGFEDLHRIRPSSLASPKRSIPPRHPRKSSPN